MSASFNVKRVDSPRPTDFPQNNTFPMNGCGYILSALSIILMIGSLAATGYLYSHTHSMAYAIGGAGVALGIATLLLSKYCCINKESTGVKEWNHSVKTPNHPNPSISLTPSQISTLRNSSSLTPPILPENKKEEPPLPFIFNLKLKDSNSLLKSIEFDNDSNTSLLPIPLSYWINRNPTCAQYENKLTDPSNQEQVEILNERVKALDEAIQLKERAQRKSCSLTMRDLLAAWPESSIKFTLMMEDELRAFTVASCLNLDEKEQKIIISNVLRLDVRNINSPEEPITQESIRGMPLINLRKIRANQIESSPHDFPPITLLLIDHSELKKVVTSKLTTEQLHLIFASTYDGPRGSLPYMRILSFEQINECIDRVEKKELFANLSDEQIVNFDFSKIDQDIFNALFTASRVDLLFPKLPMSAIYLLSTYLSNEHWEYLNEKQALTLDFSRIDESKRQRVFDIIFSRDGYSDSFGCFHSKANRRIPELSAECIYSLQPYFSYAHWQCICDKQSFDLDFSRIDESRRQRVFNIVFSVVRFPKLSVERIHSLLPYFSDEHWEYISEDQAVGLVSIETDESKRQQVFDIIFSTQDGRNSKAARRIPKLSVKHVYSLQTYFSDEHWEYIEYIQASRLDFTKIEVSKRQHVFDIVFSTHFDTYGSKAGNYIPRLTIIDIHPLLPYFSDKHWEYLTNKQSLMLDFLKIDESKRQHIFDIVFSTQCVPPKAPWRIPNLSVKSIHSLLPYFSDQHWEYLTEDQTLGLDFLKIDESKRQHVFDIVFSTRSYSYGSRAATCIPKLSVKNIHSLLPYFSDKHWEYLSKDQTLGIVLDLDFLKIDESKRQHVFNCVFSTHGGRNSEAARRIPKLSVERIHSLLPHFSDEHWEYISDAQAINLDFTKIEEAKRKEAFKILFSTKKFYISTDGSPIYKAQKLLSKLSQQQIEVVSPYLSPDACKYIKTEWLDSSTSRSFTTSLWSGVNALLLDNPEQRQ